LPRLHIVVNGGIYGCSYHLFHTGNSIGFFCDTRHYSKPRIPITPFFRFLPPVKSYYRALEAIGKLALISIEHEKTIEHPRTNKITEYTSLTKLDPGFHDLVGILMEKDLSFAQLEDIKECDEIRLMRTSTKFDIDTDKFFVWLVQIFGTPPEMPSEFQNIGHYIDWVITLGNGRELNKIIYEEGRSPIKNFYDAADDWIRMRLSNYVVGMIGVWLILSVLLIWYANHR